ncbi:MAG: glycosyltransferase family 4 protein [Saprospiraceae bacterium]|nr:glycosyltransferase family 4 protein [Saprospiraceae bacterium]
MKIIIDATWIAGQFGNNNINGGYRVIDNFIRQLYKYPQHVFYLTHTTHRESYTENLKRYHKDIASPKNIFVSAVSFKLLNRSITLKWYSFLNRKLPLNSLIPFIYPWLISKSDIYYSFLDSVPFIIRKNKRINKFFTALDLIPLIRPDISTLFYDYTLNLYKKLDLTTKIISISNSTKNDILKFRPDLEPNNIFVSYLAANETIFYKEDNEKRLSEVKNKYKIKSDQYFLTINSLAPYKNSEFVILNFLDWVYSNTIQDTHLVVIGRPLDNNFTNKLKSKYSNISNLIFLENVPDSDLAGIYSAATCFLYMSHYEGFGLPILEAFQCGTPVICSNTSSMPEVAGDAAILIDPKNSSEFINALDKIYSNQLDRERLSRLGIDRSKLFSWPKFADNIIKCFNI